MRTNQHERLTAETPEERETRLQQMRDRLAAETTEEREIRLQWMSTNQHERLAVETPEERELRLECLQYEVHGTTVCATATPTVSTVFHPSQDAKISCKHGHIGYTDMFHLFRKISWPPFPL